MDKLISTARFNKFLDACDQDQDRARTMYLDNVTLAEALFPLLHFFEVILRNKIDAVLIRMYGTSRWWEWWNDRRFDALQDTISEVKQKFLDRDVDPDDITHDDIVAGLSLGFWVSLFNSKYEKELWKAMRFVFPHLEKRRRQLTTVSPPINLLHRLRNRAFHYEPISWDLDVLETRYFQGRNVLKWMDETALIHLDTVCRFQQVLSSIRNNRQQ